jgi:hypothetical protein
MPPGTIVMVGRESLGSGVDQVVAIRESKSRSSDLVSQSKAGKGFVQTKQL